MFSRNDQLEMIESYMKDSDEKKETERDSSTRGLSSVCILRAGTAAPYVAHATNSIQRSTSSGNMADQQPVLSASAAAASSNHKFDEKSKIAAEVASSSRIYAVRIGCLLHVLRLAVTKGIESPFFMAPLGIGSWHEWTK